MLLHINRIEYCEARHIASAIIVPQTSMAIIREVAPWREIPIAGLAELETSHEQEEGTRTFNTTLSATLCGDAFELPKQPLAIRLTCANGRKYLLGTAEPPHPFVAFALSLPSEASDVTATTLNIESATDVFIIK